MPRGGGLTYDYHYLSSCIIDVVENELESGDIFFSETISYLLSQYKGLSKNDKKKAYLTPLGSLLSSHTHFVSILNRLIKEGELRPILTLKVRKHEVITALCGRTKSTPQSLYYVVD